MQGVGILTDTIHMDTQTEKAPFNKLALVGFIFFIITLIVWLPIIFGMIGYTVVGSEAMFNLVADKLPAITAFVFLPLICLTFSISALVQIIRRKERGMLLSIVTILCLVAIGYAFLCIFIYGVSTYEDI